ncbi:hypothetical protein K3495_g2340 [Podosphaera aphanis]|nr:hypothetical protein K3495_g2340 [Podosphaera aphanis]
MVLACHQWAEGRGEILRQAKDRSYEAMMKSPDGVARITQWILNKGWFEQFRLAREVEAVLKDNLKRAGSRLTNSNYLIWMLKQQDYYLELEPITCFFKNPKEIKNNEELYECLVKYIDGIGCELDTMFRAGGKVEGDKAKILEDLESANAKTVRMEKRVRTIEALLNKSQAALLKSQDFVPELAGQLVKILSGCKTKNTINEVKARRYTSDLEKFMGTEKDMVK